MSISSKGSYTITVDAKEKKSFFLYLEKQNLRQFKDSSMITVKLLAISSRLNTN